MTTVFRIGYCPSPVPPAAQLLKELGIGSTFASGRWHTKGVAQMVYSGSSRALCQLEKRVHSNGAGVRDQAMLSLQLPDDAVLQNVADLGLPSDWRTNEEATREIGDNWLAGGSSLGLWVPSIVEPLEFNLLINPQHPGYQHIAVEVERAPFTFDPRMFV